MPDTKITGLLSPQVTTNPATDVLPIVNIADTLMASSGSTRKITVNQLLGAGGTATLASATITGDLTVDTNVLKVDSANNRVGIGTASPALGFEVGYTESIFGSSTSSGYSILNFIGTGTGSARHGSIRKNYDSPFDLRIRASNSNSDAPIIFELSNASTAMTLNSTGLGVGVTPSYRFDVLGSGTISGRFKTAGAINALYLEDSGTTAGSLYIGTSGDTFRIITGSNVRVNVDSSGNVGVGVTPSAWNNSYNALDIGQNGSISGRTGANNAVEIVSNGFRNAGGTWVYKLATSNAASRYLIDGSVGGHFWYSGAAGTAGNTIAGFSTAAMTLDASGNLLVGSASFAVNNGKLRIQHSGLAGEWGIQTKSSTTDGYVGVFYTTTGQAGFISVSGTSTTFSTTSDYRLKESVQPLIGGLARINNLKPSTYKWKADGSNSEGFIAHELAEVVPLAVTGQKDAVNADGSIKPQGVDLSKLVPILVAAIQELTARVQTLEAK